MFKIEEHKNKALEWIRGVGQSTSVGPRGVVEEKMKDIPKPKEFEGIISQKGY